MSSARSSVADIKPKWEEGKITNIRPLHVMDLCLPWNTKDVKAVSLGISLKKSLTYISDTSLPLPSFQRHSSRNCLDASLAAHLGVLIETIPLNVARGRALSLTCWCMQQKCRNVYMSQMSACACWIQGKWSVHLSILQPGCPVASMLSTVAIIHRSTKLRTSQTALSGTKASPVSN